MDAETTLTRSDGQAIAYRRQEADPAQPLRPGVIFLSGYMSDMAGTKASHLAAFCHRRGQAFTRFDYFGHGQSTGDFTDGTIGRWLADTLAVLDSLTSGKQILVGSSMGGWLMLLAALARPNRVAGLVGIAAAPDFTEDLMWAQLDEPARAELAEHGIHYAPSGYSDAGEPITRKLIEEGRQHLLMRDSIDFRGPVRLLQGMADEDVPWELAPKLAERLASGDVDVVLTKDGDHRLSREADLERLERAIDRVEAAAEG